MSRFPAERVVSFASKPQVRRSVMALGALLLLYSLFGFFILPAIIKGEAESLISENLHRPATIGEVRFNPYTLVATVRDLKLTEPGGGPLFAAFDALTVNLSAHSLWRLAPVVQGVRLSKPYVHIVRTDAHRYNFDDILRGGQPSSNGRARFSVHNIQVDDGRIEFEDRPMGKTHVVAGLKLGLPFISSLPADVDVFVEPLLSAKVNDTPVLIKGKARPFAESRDAVAELSVRGLDIARYLEYLPFQPRFKIPEGRLDADLAASFVQSGDNAAALRLTGNASLKSLRITEPDGKPILALPELAVTLGETDVFGGRVEIARVLLSGLEADLRRGRDQQINLARLLPPSTPGAKPASAAAAQSSPMPGPLRFELGELEIRGATVRYLDQQPARSMRAGVEKLDLALRKVAVDTGKRSVTVGEVASGTGNIMVSHDKPQQPDTEAAKVPAQPKTDPPSGSEAPAYAIHVARVAIDNWTARLEDHSQAQAAVTTVAPLSLAMHDLSTAGAPGRIELKAAVNKSGRVALNGQLGLAPVQADLAMELQGVDMLPLQPYIADKVNLRLTRADLSGKGRLQLAIGDDGALKGGFKGDMSMNNLAALEKAGTRDLLRWKSLTFGGMDVRLQPFALNVDQVALNDFFARVIIDSSGRINVQNIVRNDAEEDHERDEGDGTHPARAGETVSLRGTRVRTAKIEAPAAPRAKPPINIRKLVLKGGRVRFTDNFIRPNYTATLTDIGGVVAGLSSDASSSATVDLQGEVNRAPLSVAGRINPLSGNLSLDIKGAVRGMELAALSAYSSRYVGYGIEKGKLSFEVAYRVENRMLTATNRLILDQLTFGEKSDSPEATQLPVAFAVALLRDRNGVIDLNVPIAGSIDDPQFSIGGIIFKAIGNAIAKAVTEPFALLGSIFGGDGHGELSSIVFDPGRATIPAAGTAKLESLAKALADRPALKLEITGRADPETDVEGLKRASIDRKVRALKMKDLQARGQPAEFGSVVVAPDEYPALLARVYRDEKFPKPRNVIGLPKKLPVEEMEQLLIANAEVDEEDLLNLGNRRAQAAKDWLVKYGKVSGERIFMLASRMEAEGSSGSGGGPAQGGVDFSLK